MKSPTVLLESLLTDVRRLMPGVKGIDRDIITVDHRFENEGVGFLTVALPTIGEALVKGLACGKFTCPFGFSKLKGGALPKFLSGLLCEVFDVKSGHLKEEPSVEAIKLLREVTQLFKKLTLISARDEDLDQKAKVQFVLDDNKCLTSLSWDERSMYIIESVCRYILPNIETFDESELNFRHGPGAVFEKYGPNQKWSSLLTHSSELERMGFDCVYYASSGHNSNLDFPLSEYGVSGDIARLVTVPKNSTSKRTITVEPVVRQFVQQGYNELLRDHILKCPILNQCLALTDQSKNQILAVEGSIHGNWSTLDLKSASDLLSVRLVEQVFKFRPRFLSGILSCRSPMVQVDNVDYALRKFAGMGNATTFPVQSVVFAVLAISALLNGLKPSYANVKRVSRHVRVYGDDIIVPTDHVHQVVNWLTTAGLTVNHGKSFSTGNFRESCGVDAFKGVDVTPLYVKHFPDRPSFKEPKSFAHLVELSNQAWMRGLYSLSQCLRNHVEGGLRKPLPLVGRDSPGLGWHTRQNSSLIQRWNRDLHRYEVLAPVIRPLKRSDRIDGYAALLKFWFTPLLGRDRDHLEKSPVKYKSSISLRWVPSLTSKEQESSV